MEKVSSAMAFKAHKTLCKVCDKHFFEFDEQKHVVKWVGSEVIDWRITHCPHCGNQNEYNSVETMEKADVYLEIDALTGDLKVYGGFDLPQAIDSTESA